LSFFSIRAATLKFFWILFSKAGSLKPIGKETINSALGLGIDSQIIIRLTFAIIAFAEILGLLILGFVGIFLLPTVSLTLITYLLLVYFSSQLLLSRKARLAAAALTQSRIDLERVINDAFENSTEIVRRGEFPKYLREFLFFKSSTSQNYMRGYWYNLLPKFTFESFMILGALLLGVLSNMFLAKSQILPLFTVLAVASFRFLPSLLRIQSSLNQIQNAREFARTVDKIEPLVSESAVQEIHELGNALLFVGSQLGNFDPAIIFSNVSFAYSDADNSLLKNSSFTLPSRGLYVITGESGSGKTSLLRLVLGVENPSEGKIKIGGIDPRMSGIFYTDEIIYIQQNPRFYDLNLRDFFTSARDNVSRSEDAISNALSSVGYKIPTSTLAEFIDTPLRTLESRLSGGQKQRLLIARALLEKPKILLLDEVTNALDSDSINVILCQLRVLSKDTLILFVSHQKSILEAADSIIKLQNGVLGINKNLKNTNDVV
jgi:ABC-type bacteriocin/lantibiotic exporter with double-glycine peptidase domain